MPHEDPDRLPLVETFRALRAELLVRILIQNALLAGVTLASLATCVAMAFVPGAAWWLAACQVLANGAAGLMWVHGGARTTQISAYLAEVVEPRLFPDPRLGWESWHHRRGFPGLLGSRWTVSTVGIFLGTQLLVSLAAAIAADGFGNGIGSAVAFVATASTALLLRHPHLGPPPSGASP